MIINISNQSTLKHLQSITKNNQKYKISTEDKYLSYENNVLKLFHQNKELFIDFNSNEILNRINPKSKKCSVVQAVEGRSKNILYILDTTAGLGRDTFTLAAKGHKLISIEKDTYIFLLLTDALNRAKGIEGLSAIANRITLLNTDSNDFIKANNTIFDCVYIDPMFPIRRKSAKVKQGMQVLHQIAFNNEQSNNDLLKNIIHSKMTKKAIVKRPINAESLHEKKPSSQLKGKTNRFDIYSL